MSNRCQTQYNLLKHQGEIQVRPLLKPDDADDDDESFLWYGCPTKDV